MSQQHQQHQNNSSFELIEDSTDYSTVIPAEALLGISPTSNETAGRFSCSSVDPFSKKSGPTKIMNFSGPFFPTKVVVDQGFQSGQLRKTGFFILGLNYITLCNVGSSFYISKHFFA